MRKSADSAAVAASLATVAIAALGGPIAATGAALREIVAFGERTLTAQAPARDLRHAVAGAVVAWAEGERVRDVDLGLDLATRVIAQFGATAAEQAHLAYDADGLAELVWQRAAHAGYPEVATDEAEDHVVVARRAVRVTYGALNSQLAARELTMPALTELLRRVHSQDAALARIEASLAVSPRGVLEASARADHLPAGANLGPLRALIVQGESIVRRLERFAGSANPAWEGVEPEAQVTTREYTDWDGRVRARVEGDLGADGIALLDMLSQLWQDELDRRQGYEIDRALGYARRTLAVLRDLNNSAG